MRNTPTASVAIALASALCGLLLWSLIRDTGWSEYQGAAALTMTQDVFIESFEARPPPTGPDPDLEPICDMMRAATGLGADELAYGAALPVGGITRIDHEALQQQWAELGVVGRLRVTLFGLSRDDHAGISKAITTDRSRLRVDGKMEQAMKACRWQAHALSFSRSRR